MRFLLVKVVTLAFILSIGAAIAQSNPSTASTSQLDELRAQGYQALYNLDYNTARKYFREMIQTAPDNPVGTECLATSIWVQQLNEQWQLKGSLYSNKATDETGKPDPQEATEFRNSIRQTKQLSQLRQRRDPHDQD